MKTEFESNTKSNIKFENLNKKLFNKKTVQQKKLTEKPWSDIIQTEAQTAHKKTQLHNKLSLLLIFHQIS